MKLLIQHLSSNKDAWITIFSKPIEHFINIIVLTVIIGICLLAITIGNNLDFWTKNNIAYPQIMLYLDKNASANDINLITRHLNKLSAGQIRNYKFISKAQALNELQHDKTLKEIANDNLDEANNPLPDVFIIETNTTNADKITGLNLQLGQLPKVTETMVDMDYANKIAELLFFSSQVIMLIQIIGIAIVALVTYNLIRLQMLLKVDAISVARLIGASDSFIMRPLIHYALLQVTIAFAAATGIIYLLTKHVNHLLAGMQQLFGNNAQILFLPVLHILTIWLVLIVFTISTVFLAVRWVFRNTYHN